MMIGYQCMGVSIGVETEMPYRKKPCLVVKKGNTGTKYASFNNMESAQEFMNIFAEFVGAEKLFPDRSYDDCCDNECVSVGKCEHDESCLK